MRIPDTFPDPVFYDKKVADINVDLTALEWIEYVHPIVQIGVDEEGTFPEVYRNDGKKKSERVYPHGNSISFFEMNTPITCLNESDIYLCELTLIVWADLTKVYPLTDYNYTSTLIKEVVNVIESHSGYDLQIDTTDVFSNYSELEKIENQNTMLPNTAFKITFNTDIKICAGANEGVTLDNEDNESLGILNN